MRKITATVAAIVIALSVAAAAAHADGFDYNPKSVIEESFYLVPPENRDEFLRLYRERMFPFWEEMRRMGVIRGRYRMFSQRLHTAKPVWTYKTVVYFADYASVDRWLKVRDKVYERLFPGEGGYKGARAEIDALYKPETHWDEFIREVPMDE